MRSLRTVLLGVAVLSVGCGSDASSDTDARPRLDEAAIGQPAGPNAAMYFVLSNEGPDDRLVAFSADVGAVHELHELAENPDGSLAMRRLEGVDVPSGERVVFAPGGNHGMLIDVQELELGTAVAVELTFESGHRIIADVEVISADEVVELAERLEP